MGKTVVLVNFSTSIILSLWKVCLVYFVVALSHELVSRAGLTHAKKEGCGELRIQMCPTTLYSVVQSCCSIFHKTCYIAD